MNEEELKNKEKELKEQVENLMYATLAPADQAIINNYIRFLKEKISYQKMSERDKQYYKEQYQKEQEECNNYKITIVNLTNKYNEICQKLARTEIDLDIARDKIKILEGEKGNE